MLRLPAGMAGLCAMLVVECGAAAHRIPTHPFAGEPRGRYLTGTVEGLWIDSQRTTAASSRGCDERHLMVQIWYPAHFDGNAPRAHYVLHRDLYPIGEDSRWLDETAHVRTNSVMNAPLAHGVERFPVLIYNPGAGHPPFSATFQTEFMASHGYVVVAIGHPETSGIERFPDGCRWVPAVTEQDLDGTVDPAMHAADRFRLRVQQYARLLMPAQVQDIRFVLDRLRVIDDTRRSRFYQRLDVDRVGSFGWSIGGALSLQASRDEPRIKAAVNLDGWLYTDVQDTGTERPIMIIHGERTQAGSQVDAAERELAWVAGSLPWRLYSRTTADWYDIDLRNAGHEHFSDRPLFGPYDAEAIHPRVAHEIVNRATLEFFDKYLRQARSTPLLCAEETYPDTRLSRKVSK